MFEMTFSLDNPSFLKDDAQVAIWISVISQVEIDGNHLSSLTSRFLSIFRLTKRTILIKRFHEMLPDLVYALQEDSFKDRFANDKVYYKYLLGVLGFFYKWIIEDHVALNPPASSKIRSSDNLRCLNLIFKDFETLYYQCLLFFGYHSDEFQGLHSLHQRLLEDIIEYHNTLSQYHIVLQEANAKLLQERKSNESS